MKKKLIALLLCLMLVASVAIPGTLAVGLDSAESTSEMSVAASAETASVFFGQEYANTVSVPVDGKSVLSVGCTADILSVQWQIYAPAAGVWANIYGETGSTCAVSYAMVRSMLDGDGLAKVRCLVSVADGSVVTQEVSLGVDTSAVPAQNEAPAAESPVVLSDTVVTANTAEAPAAAAAPAMFSLPQNEEPAGEEPAGEEPAGDDSAPLNEPAPTGEDTPSTYNVVINYLFENGEIVADPYTASLAAGSSFSATVTFPTVLGYLPYLNEVQQNSIDLNYTAIDKDYTYDVVYKPTNVDYTVIHYQQNVDNDQYTEAERETKQGLTKSTVPEVAKTYDGFTALLYEKPAIAADGSTLVEIYYDRNYYLMNFDLDGGYGVEPIYARYGTPISAVGTPTKAGYSFGGWSLDGTNTVDLPSTMPAENRTYKAVWTADDTAKVTVVFWGENADDEGYSYIKSAQVNVKPGTEFTYSENGTLICALEVHTHDASCGYACNQTEHIHEADCYALTCTQELHEHNKDCCTLEEHTHNIGCLWGLLCGKQEHTHGDGQCTCPKEEHTHTDYTGSCYALSCTIQEHVHSDNCGYNCNKTEHAHTSGCYMSGAGLDSNLWTFVQSDTVTVAADGSSVVNVYYDRTEKTLTFKYNYRSGNYRSTETITAKWGSNIAEQYKKIAAKAGSTFWSAQTSGESPFTNYFGVMPQTSATYYNQGDTGDEGTMTYWGQDLNGNYTVKLFEVTGVGGYTVSDEDRYEFEGFTYDHGTSNGKDCGGAAFYYKRNSYTLTFNDGYNDVKTESFKYEAPLSSYRSYVPVVPSAYEPGSVTFGGWYLNPECTGAEYKLDEHTMPADNVLLYAKWVPVTHTVAFYLDKAALDTGTRLSTHPDITVPHGAKADPTPADPSNGSYTFIGWFYMEDGVEKAFDFANMPVTKDLQVYGKWSSNVLKEYTIYYKYKDAGGNEIEIAAPTTGSGLAGATKTFEAKGGTDLYADYQAGYFPVTKSHSMTLDIENDANNTFTFWYVQKEAVPYTVKYLNKETGAPVATEKIVSDNRKAVVTETFVPVSGMMPDAYQKRLVVSAEEGAVNEIIFYYTEDTTHAYYKITHYTENLGTDASGNPTWTEYASSQAVGDIGSTYNADPMTIPGFTYSADISKASGKLTANGLELNLYYTRNSYPYQVRYLEQGSGKQLAEPKNDIGKYGQVISESAIGIANYDAVDPTSQTMNIKIEESQTEAKLNIITFYYTEKKVTIHYQVVGPDGCGTVSPTSETLKVLSGTAQGSTATANENFRFVGWFKDAGCTQAVDASWVKENKLTPVKAKDAVWTAATYYAKFEYNLTSLTITKTIKKGGGNENDSFIFDVQNNSGEKFTVSVKGNSSVTIAGLKVGDTYTVTERGSWSWRYRAAEQKQNITLQPTDNNVTVTNSLVIPYLLDGSDYRQNNAATYKPNGN